MFKFILHMYLWSDNDDDDNDDDGQEEEEEEEGVYGDCSHVPSRVHPSSHPFAHSQHC